MGIKNNCIIVADSSAELRCLDGVDFASAPLKIIADKNIFTDDSSLDVDKMLETLAAHKGKSSTSCPNPNDWASAFGSYENVFCIALTSELSGSYNAACTAKKIYEEKNPERRVFVINSKSAGPELMLIAEKLAALVLEGFEFDKICEKITEYQKNTGLLFSLESLKNLANNGRVSKFIAKVAGILGIRVVGCASDAGTLEMLDKSRGEKKAIDAIFKCMKGFGYNGGKVRISHCFNEAAAKRLETLILAEYKDADIEMHLSGGLCGFYAERGGLLVGYEREK